MAVGAAEKETLQFLFEEILVNVLGIVDEQGGEGASNGNMSVIEGLMEMVLAERAEAKANKDWTKSDFIRDKLKEIGVQVTSQITCIIASFLYASFVYGREALYRV